MSLYNRGGLQVQGNNYGELALKGPLVTPQSTTSTLCTVSGAVMVAAIAGRVSTVLTATATNLSIGTTPGASNSIMTATAITSSPVGYWIVPTSASGVGGVPLLGYTPFLASDPFLVAPGVITWTCSGNNSGQIQWYLWYSPVDPGATVS